jgi:hypothetical protein
LARGGEEGGGEREGRGAKEGIDTGHGVLSFRHVGSHKVPYPSSRDIKSVILASSLAPSAEKEEDERLRTKRSIYSCGESKHVVVEASCCDRGRIVEQENAQRLSNNNKAIFAISLFGLCWNMVTLRDQSTELYVEREQI